MNFPRKSLRRAALFASGAFLGAPSFVQAQQAPAQSANPVVAPAAPIGLSEVVVTARKRAENLQNIPVAETVLQGANLQSLGVSSVEEVANVAPQLIISRTGPGNGSSISLRGISVNTTSVSLEQSVATVIDGVYYSGGRALNEGLFDVGQVEVLKGPQSLFYGKNTTAGVISITTADPQTTFGARLSAGYEFVGREPSLEGMVTGPITDTLSFRIAGMWSKQYGALFKNVSQPQTIVDTDIATGATSTHVIPAAPTNAMGREMKIFRTGLKWKPTDRFTATVKASYDENDANTANANQVRIVCPTGVAQTDPAAPCGRKRVIIEQGVPADIAATNKILNMNGGQPFINYQSYNITGNFAYGGDLFNVSVVPGYAYWQNSFLGDFDHSTNFPTPSVDGNHGSEETRSTAFSTEVRLQTTLHSPVNFMVGGYYQKNNLYFHQDIVFPGGFYNTAVADKSLEFLTIRKISFTHGETWSGFGEVLYDITPQLNLTVGARYTDDKKVSQFGEPYVVPPYLAAFQQTTFGATQDFSNFSPEGTLTWKPTHNLTAYASYKTGFKSGGYSISGLISAGQSPDAPAFGSEKVRGVEGGVKSTWLDNQLRVNFDAFVYTYTGLQVDFFNASTISYFDLNAGSARTKGAEVAVEYAPRAVPGLHLQGTLGYTDAYYASFPFAPCLAGQSIAEGCVIGSTPQGVRPNQNLSGEHTPQAPEWTGSVSVDYTRPISETYKVGASLLARFSSSYSLNAFANHFATRFIQPDYGVLDLNLRLINVPQHWQLELIGKNLTNTFYATAADDSPYTGAGAGTLGGVPGDTLASVNDPRTVALRFTLQY